MPLTDTAIRKTKPTDTVQKLRDGGGLYLLLRPDGAKWWRWDYRRPVTGKRNTLSLGTYPEVSLASVRERHAAARKLLAEGVDPGEQRKAQKVASLESASNTFEALAREHLAMRAKKLSTGSVKREQRLIDKDLTPYIGQRPIASIVARDLLDVLRRIEGRGAVETAHRARMLASQVFRYAIATGRAERNPAEDLKGALSTPEGRHFASMTEPKLIADLLRAPAGARSARSERPCLQPHGTLGRARQDDAGLGRLLGWSESWTVAPYCSSFYFFLTGFAGNTGNAGNDEAIINTNQWFAL